MATRTNDNLLCNRFDSVQYLQGGQDVYGIRGRGHGIQRGLKLEWRLIIAQIT